MATCFKLLRFAGFGLGLDLPPAEEEWGLIGRLREGEGPRLADPGLSRGVLAAPSAFSSFPAIAA